MAWQCGQTPSTCDYLCRGTSLAIGAHPLTDRRQMEEHTDREALSSRSRGPSIFDGAQSSMRCPLRQVPMDGKGRWSRPDGDVASSVSGAAIKYEDVYLHAYETLRLAPAGLDSATFSSTTGRRRHSSLETADAGCGVLRCNQLQGHGGLKHLMAGRRLKRATVIRFRGPLAARSPGGRTRLRSTSVKGQVS